MKYSRRFGSTVLWHCAANLFFLLTLSIFALQLTAYAQEQPILKASFARDANQIINIDLVVGQSRVIELDEPCDVIQTSTDKIVSTALITARTIVINAVGIGQAQVAVAKKITPPNLAEQTLVFRVFVQKDLSLLDNQIKILYPKENIQLSQVNESVVLSGSVTKPEIAEDVEKILKTAKIDFTNLLRVPAVIVQQVKMDVRIAEVNRTALREIGAAYGIMNLTSPVYINPGGVSTTSAAISGGIGAVGSPGGRNVSLTGGLVNLFLGRPDMTSAFIRAVYERGAVRSLAEPSIITANGKQGSFLSGGRVPIPNVSGNNGLSSITFTYQEYGVRLAFTPRIKDENHITIELETEVSSPDGPGVNSGGIIIPGIRARTAKTTLELADGQSFAMAGLLDNSERVDLSKIPGIGNIPILGELFKSRRFSRSETELLFLCTVNMVTPLNPDQIPRLPGAPPSNTNAPAKPDAATSGAAIAPMLNAAPSSLSFPTAGALEGESGHAVPRKVVKAKTDN
jgi:pilus assembly protein CpaC